MTADRTSLALCVDVLGPLTLRVEGSAGRRAGHPPARPVRPAGARRAAAASAWSVWSSASGPRSPLPTPCRPSTTMSRDCAATSARWPNVWSARAPAIGCTWSPTSSTSTPLAGSPAPSPDVRHPGGGRPGPRRTRALARPGARGVPDAVRSRGRSRWASTSSAGSWSTTCSEARLATGRPSVAADAAAAAAAAPLRERTALLHVRALAADGRTAEAMAAGAAFRTTSRRGDRPRPGPALGELEQPVAAGSMAGPAETSLTCRCAPRVVTRPDGPLVGRQPDREEVLRLLGHQRDGDDHRAGWRRQDPAGARRGGRDRRQAQAGDVVVSTWPPSTGPDRVCQAVASTLVCGHPGELAPADIAAPWPSGSCCSCSTTASTSPEACRDLVVHLAAARRRRVRVLATSRVTLHVPGEYVVRLQPLRCRETPRAWRRCVAIRGPSVRRARPPRRPTSSSTRRTPSTWWRCCAARRAPAGHRAGGPPGRRDAAACCPRAARPRAGSRHRESRRR